MIGFWSLFELRPFDTGSGTVAYRFIQLENAPKNLGLFEWKREYLPLTLLVFLVYWFWWGAR